MAGTKAMARVNTLLGENRFAEAARVLGEAAEAGHSDCLLTLAVSKLSGQWMPRDLAGSRDLFRRAAEAGNPDAAAVYAAFLANGTGGRPNWAEAVQYLAMRSATDAKARTQLDLIGAMSLTPDGSPKDSPPPKLLSASPHVAIFPGLFTRAECAYLAEAAKPLFEPAVVVDPQTGRQIRNPIRTSDNAYFTLALEDPAVHALNRRIATASGTTPEQGEPLQVLRYRPGQEFKEHSDALPVTDNQRVATVLVYLNDAYEGGETRFLSTGLSVRGAVGDALFFRNVTSDGRPDPQAIHAGLPVTRGTKLLASRWLRARPLSLERPLTSSIRDQNGRQG